MEGQEGHEWQEGHEGHEGHEGQEGQEGHVHKLEFLLFPKLWAGYWMAIYGLGWDGGMDLQALG